jgi:hypothetical protein
VRYIAEVHGDDALRQVIDQLRAGRKMNQTIQSVLAMNYSEYEQSWQQWAAINMKHNQK